MANTQVAVSAGVNLTPTVTISYLGMEDLLWVLDGDTVQIRSRDNLTIIKSFGSTGTGDDEFATPTTLCADQDSVYVLDGGNSRIKKHAGKTGAYQAQTPVTWIAGAMTPPIVVDRLRLLFGETAVNAYVYVRNKNTFAEEHAYFDCGLGAVVGLAITDGYFFVAIATQVEKRLLSDGSLIATWDSVPAGFAVAGLTADATYVYALCTQAATDCKIVKLYQTDLMEHSSDDMTDKQSPMGICCDDDYVYFLNLSDTTVNRVDNDLDPASLFTSGGVTAAMHTLCCLPPYYDDLTPEATGDLVASGSATASGTAVIGTKQQVAPSGSATTTGTAVIAKEPYLSPSGSASVTGAAAIAKEGKIAPSGSAVATGTAVISKVGAVAASGSATVTGAAVVEAGSITADIACAVATIGLGAVDAIATRESF